MAGFDRVRLPPASLGMGLQEMLEAQANVPFRPVNSHQRGQGMGMGAVAPRSSLAKLLRTPATTPDEPPSVGKSGFSILGQNHQAGQEGFETPQEPGQVKHHRPTFRDISRREIAPARAGPLTPKEAFKNRKFKTPAQAEAKDEEISDESPFRFGKFAMGTKVLSEDGGDTVAETQATQPRSRRRHLQVGGELVVAEQKTRRSSKEEARIVVPKLKLDGARRPRMSSHWPGKPGGLRNP